MLNFEQCIYAPSFKKGRRSRMQTIDWADKLKQELLSSTNAANSDPEILPVKQKHFIFVFYTPSNPLGHETGQNTLSRLAEKLA